MTGSFPNVHANKAAKTGSNASIKETRIGSTNCCATTCITKADNVGRRARKRMIPMLYHPVIEKGRSKIIVENMLAIPTTKNC